MASTSASTVAGGVVGAHARADHPGLHASRVGRPAVGDDGLRPGGTDAVGRRPGVADQTRPGAQRGAGAEDGGPGIGRRTGDDPHHALRVLVVAGRRHGQPAGDVGIGELDCRRRRQVLAEADVDQVHLPGVAAALAHHQAGLDGAERHGVHGQEGRALDGAGVGVDAARHVDGDRDAGALGGGPGERRGVRA